MAMCAGDQGITGPGGPMGQSGKSARRHRELLPERDRIGAGGDDRSLSGERGAQGSHVRRSASLLRGTNHTVRAIERTLLNCVPGGDSEASRADRVHEDSAHGDAQQAHQAEDGWLL